MLTLPSRDEIVVWNPLNDSLAANTHQPDMDRIPRYRAWRPDFEAPGPHVFIHRLNGVSFETSHYIDPNDYEAEDDDFPHYNYYESKKIIGRLYREIDERKIYEEIQQRAMKVGMTNDSEIIDALWGHIQDTCSLIQWDHLLEDARGIRDM